MNKLNTKDVMRALECCTRGRKHKDDRPCLECPYNFCNIVGGTDERQVSGTCQGWMMKDALALLHEKDATIDALNGLFVKATSDAEQERFQCKNICKPTYKNLLETARAEAITEFAERLKRFYRNLSGKTVGGSVEYHIEQIAKEMKEGLNAT